MNQKFGAAKQPTGTPSLVWSCVVVIASLLAGASVVHNIYKPDLNSSRYLDTLKVPVEDADEATKKQAANAKE
ncbi:Growth hormone receptor [Gossypium arboreum]|uniref:Growth hormone receptor n=1 Tax=Gossypium arboreum TaxID=29729 RepID=A0A0B0PHU4_GOSAR|nr:Growth hormone receptor [Gossypium arboreum]